MTPQQKENYGDETIERGIWKKIPLKKMKGVDSNLTPFNINAKFLDVHIMLRDAAQDEIRHFNQKFPLTPQAETSAQRLLRIARRMCVLLENLKGEEHFTLVDMFLEDVHPQEKKRLEILTAVLDRLTELEFPAKWCNMRVIRKTLGLRVKSFGVTAMEILGMSSFRDHEDYSLSTYFLALYSSIVTENQRFFKGYDIAKFRTINTFDWEIIKTPDFKKFVQFVVVTFLCGEQKLEEIYEAEGQATIEKLGPNGRNRRAAMHNVVRKIRWKKEAEEEAAVPRFQRKIVILYPPQESESPEISSMGEQSEEEAVDSMLEEEPQLESPQQEPSCQEDSPEEMMDTEQPPLEQQALVSVESGSMSPPEQSEPTAIRRGKREEYRLLNRYMTVRTQDIRKEFYDMVFRQTQVPQKRIQSFFRRLKQKRASATWSFTPKSLEDFSRLYG